MTTTGINKNSGTIWGAAALVAALGTWIVFEALPGINWLLWTTAAVIGLAAIVRASGRTLGAMPLSAGVLLVLIAGAAAKTADPVVHAMIVLVVMLMLAVTMLLSVDPRLERVSAAFVLTAPFIAGARAIVESLSRAVDATRVVQSDRARAAVRGIAITAPVILFFALLLAGADPVFDAWRDALIRLVESWAFVPRTIFFIMLLTIVLGAYGYAARSTASGHFVDDGLGAGETSLHMRWLGETERLILLASVGTLFWIFLALQLSYLFGNLPATTGSGITFAEHARQGFGELTVVATSTVVLILLSERFGQKGARDGLLRLITLAVIAAVMILLGSAYHRVSLYEAAYGFTTSRLYAQVYMLVVVVTLIVLALETRHDIDPSRVFRRAGATALAAFIVMIYWNHEGWIARANMSRFATTGKLDVVYLVRDLSPNAVPAIIAGLPSLPEPIQIQLRSALTTQYQNKTHLAPRRWYEWNSGRMAAGRELTRIGISLEPRKPVVSVPPSRVQAAIR